MTATATRVDTPRYEDLVAVAELVQSGNTSYDIVSDVAHRALNGYPFDEADYVRVALPEMQVDEQRVFRGGAANVTRVDDTTWRISYADPDYEPELVDLDEAAEAIPAVEYPDNF